MSPTIFYPIYHSLLVLALPAVYWPSVHVVLLSVPISVSPHADGRPLGTIANIMHHITALFPHNCLLIPFYLHIEPSEPFLGGVTYGRSFTPE